MKKKILYCLMIFLLVVSFARIPVAKEKTENENEKKIEKLEKELKSSKRKVKKLKKKLKKANNQIKKLKKQLKKYKTQTTQTVMIVPTATNTPVPTRTPTPRPTATTAVQRMGGGNPPPGAHSVTIKDYSKRNLASFGYTSLGGDRRDDYGSVNFKLVINSEEGIYFDPEDEDQLADYVVVDQSPKPNESVYYKKRTDSEGNEYNYLVDWTSLSQINLFVKRVGSDSSGAAPVLTQAQSKYLYYVKDYTGQNVASCSYYSWGGDRRDEYGASSVELILVSEDGSYVDPETDAQDYVVYGQSPAPKTPITLTFMTDSEGEEYANLVNNMSVSEIVLYVRKVY